MAQIDLEEQNRSLNQLLDNLKSGLSSLEEENRTLRQRVAQLGMRVSELEAVRPPEDLPLPDFMADLAGQVRARVEEARRGGAEVDQKRLRVLASLVDFLAESGPRPASPAEPGAPVGRPELRVLPPTAATKGAPGTATDGAGASKPQSARPDSAGDGEEPEPIPETNPAAVLAGPTSDAPPHRVAFRPARRPIPGMEGVRLRDHTHMYEEGWLEKHAPWAIDLIIRLDLERVERAADRAAEIAGTVVAALVAPMAPALDAIGRVFSHAGAVVGAGVARAFDAIPLPGPVHDFLSSRPARPVSADGPAVNQLTKSRYESMVWLGVIASTFVHFAMFAFWPTLEAEDFSVATEELTAIEMPPEVEVPPPPQQIARPATPVMATDAFVEEDVTIAPTTFEENPVEELPPPPEEVVEEAASTPTFTPFTVAPRITNTDELARLLRSEYPPMLREAGIGGQVVVWFHVDEEGRLQDKRIFQSSGHQALDDAALRVAEQFRFTPALDGDRRVPVWIQFPLTFQVR